MLPSGRRFCTWAVFASFAFGALAPYCRAADSVSMNLSSTQRSVTASQLLHSGSLSINVGGKQLPISGSTLLTPAELLAVSQVLSSGRQTILLGARGNAVGGSFLLNSAGSQTYSTMAVPRNVTGVLNYLQAPAFNIAGNLADLGRLYAATSNSSISSVAINATNITVGPGALLSSVVPSGGLPGISNPRGDLSLILNALRSIVNNGTISSANDLTLQSPRVTNHGLIRSENGSINLFNPALGSLGRFVSLNNTYGQIQAPNGAVNVGGADVEHNSIISMFGGTINAPAINFNSGAGTIYGVFDRLVGTVNASGFGAHVGGKSGLLQLGDLNLSGDPTFFNQGDIMITGDIIVGENLAILASGNVLSSGAHYISTTNGTTGDGNDVYIVAGARLIPAGSPLPTGSATAPNNPLLPGQTVTVAGPARNLNGGNIDLSDSIIDTTGVLGKDGGNVTLVAYSNGGSGGGIGNMSIFTGGSQTGKNGSVTVIAGGTLSGNVAVDRVAINAVGSSNAIGAPVNIYAATPLGSATFDSTGKATGPLFSFGQPTNADIHVSLPIQTESGKIVIVTNGQMVNTASIDSSGFSSGRSAGDIAITAGSIDVEAPIRALGFKGADGAVGLPGMIGRGGKAGGNGGDVTLVSANTIILNSDIFANGALGGNGGKGGDGGTNQSGGLGGLGGAGGMAGSITLKTTNSDIVQSALTTLSASGGSGGLGGDGGAAGIGTTRGLSGGTGGLGGGAQIGGKITASSGTGNQTFNGSLIAVGGDGGSGGAGADGGSGTAAGGVGGSSGLSGGGAKGGSIALTTSSGNVVLNIATVNGGAGAASNSSGNGGSGATGGNGGTVFGAGSGGDGGRISVISKTGAVTLVSEMDVYGGIGGDMSANAGNGGKGNTSIGGNGGKVGLGGAGGDGGRLEVNTGGAVSASALIYAYGGDGTSISAFGGKGGDGGSGGMGGSVGRDGAGGAGGSVSLTSTSPLAMTVAGDILAFGGIGGAATGRGGDGGAGLSGRGGSGGSVGTSGDGGKGGSIELSSGGDVVISSTQLLAAGSDGGASSAQGGSGGTGTSGAGGAGGSVFDTGAGGAGGKITVKSDGNITPFGTMSANGGNGGGVNGIGGDGATGFAGGNGGNVGNAGAGGDGGIVKFDAPQDSVTVGNINIDQTSVLANGGMNGSYVGSGGQGGNAAVGHGGTGGSLGFQSKSGDGGSIFINGSVVNITDTGFVYAKGGYSSSYGNGVSSSGNGGRGGSAASSNGGDGGRVGFGGSAGDGGYIQIGVTGAMSIFNSTASNPDTGVDTISVRGGSVQDNHARSGRGGDASPTGQSGGDGGTIGNNGSAGKGGSVVINGGSGDLTGLAIIAAIGGQVQKVLAVTGAGGNAGTAGKGGDGGGYGNNGNGGDGGKITISTSSGNVTFNPLLAIGEDVNGEFSPHTGSGGNGGTSKGAGGDSGSIGHNGFGGDGGVISLTSQSGSLGPPGNISAPYLVHAGIIAPAFPRTGDGGSSVNLAGGDSGNIGDNGKAGNGGTVLISTFSGNIYTPKGTIGSAGADGGFWGAVTGNGGSSVFGAGGKSGNIGKNSDGGDGGLVKLVSLQGDVTVNGAIIIPGGVGNGNISQTGNGGSTILGNGGDSGSIGVGGNGGHGGTLVIKAGGNITTSERVAAEGGDAAALLYAPSTGNGGNGSSKGGDSGSIGSAGRAGEGGTVEVTSTGGDIAPDAFNVDGGCDGAKIPIPNSVPFQFVYIPSPMQAKTGNGGSGGIAGGNAGVVGDAVAGGKGGSISVYAEHSILQSVFYHAPGGKGGDQLSTGGRGGDGGKDGGKGGAVGSAGDGGGGGSISLTANLGPTINVKELTAAGADGGTNGGIAGDGGNATGLGAAGKGGSLGDSGSGGKGGKLDVEITNLAGAATFFVVSGNSGLNLYGGNGGALTGKAGNGGGFTGTAILDSVGGEGGSTGFAGGGGRGGIATFKLPSGTGTFPDTNLNGGAAGQYSATAGDGGSGSKNKPGGKGGSTGDQGNGGDGGLLIYSGGSFAIDNSQPLVQIINANGGNAPSYAPVAGNGAGGGGAGGDGGSAGSAGSGGNAGKIKITAEDNVNLLGIVTADGGQRLQIFEVAGTGGDAGLTKGGAGGAGGSVHNAGGGGLGGSIEITSLLSTVTSNNLISANGGSSQGAIMFAGSGGNGAIEGRGGDGGAIGIGPAAGNAGLGAVRGITIHAASDISLTDVSLKGGSVLGALAGVSGSGGNGGSAAGDGGAGGKIAGAGDAGDGGRLELASLVGNVSVSTLNANGGNSNDLTANSGGGGSQATGEGAGGISGGVGNNGNAGTGGTIKITTLGSVQGNAAWTANGGSVGTYFGSSGDGGAGAPAIHGIRGAAGGGSGHVGDNGKAGTGGTFSIKAWDLDVTFNDVLTANGGDVTGSYLGSSGNGGSGGASGGTAGGLGSNGAAGAGGSITVETHDGAVNTSLVSASGGTGAEQHGTGGIGGTSTKTGGEGGDVGQGTAAGWGGRISLKSEVGAITVNGNVAANGGAGGVNNGVAGRGGDGVAKGGGGGSVAAAGSGGKGGIISLYSESRNVTVNGSVTANKGDGGAQNGQAGDGGDATGTDPRAEQGFGGVGGSVADAGAAGLIGFFGAKNGLITLRSDAKNITVSGDVRADGGIGGANTGVAGTGGSGIQHGGIGGSVGFAGKGASGGMITLKVGANSSLITINGVVSVKGGDGGQQSGTGGNGGDTTGPVGIGGKGGSVQSSGSGGNRGTIFITQNLSTPPTITPIISGGAAGGISTAKAGTGGAGHPKGPDGTVADPGVAGTSGQIEPIAFTEALGSAEVVVDVELDEVP